ncbi:MAG: cytochrome c biogenesis protein ResB, partial [Actinomycetota bacterium]|nr:cytochrome c biogenesis protein ResB [Actinomycetota bacterium]
YVNRRRVWVRTGTHEDGRTMVEYGLLARGEDHRLASEAAAIRGLLLRKWNLESDTSDGASGDAGASGLDGAGRPSSPTSPAGSAEPKKDR